MSVCRNYLNIWESINFAEKSTFMKDAKIAGGIKNYSTQDSIYEIRCYVEEDRPTTDQKC